MSSAKVEGQAMDFGRQQTELVSEWQERLNKIDPTKLTRKEVKRLASAQEALAVALALDRIKAHVDSIPTEVRGKMLEALKKSRKRQQQKGED